MTGAVVITPDYPTRGASLMRRDIIAIRIRVGSWRAHLNALNTCNPASTTNSHPAGDLPPGRITAGACCVIARLRHHYEEKAAHCLPEMEVDL